MVRAEFLEFTFFKETEILFTYLLKDFAFYFVENLESVVPNVT